MLAAVRGGAHTRAEIRRSTGLGYTEINRALYELEHERRVVDKREDVNFVRWYVRGKDPADTSPAQAQEVGHERATQHESNTCSPIEAVVVSDARLAPAIERSVEREVKPVSIGARLLEQVTSGFNEDAASGQTTAEDFRAREVRKLDTALEALHAARVELLYSQYWGEASPRIEQVVEMVEKAVAA